MNLKGTVSTLPDAKGDLFVQMGILRSRVNIRDLELIREDDISATLGDGSSTHLRRHGGRLQGKENIFHRQREMATEVARSGCQNHFPWEQRSISSA